MTDEDRLAMALWALTHNCSLWHQPKDWGGGWCALFTPAHGDRAIRCEVRDDPWQALQLAYERFRIRE